LIAFAALALIAGLAVYVATTVEPRDLAGGATQDLSVKAASVPSVAAAKAWINSPPLGRDVLRGKVVVYDFWTYSCVNCVRTIPHLRALYDRYRDAGLVIVGIHSPEFDFEKDHGNVERAVARLGVTWPVALDDDMAIWNAFANQYWPAEYLTDREGRLRQVYIGEGNDDQKESDIRTLLGVPASAPRAADAGPEQRLTATQTPEIHFGLQYGAASFSSSPEPYVDGTSTFTAPEPVPDDSFALTGQWTIGNQAATASDPSASIVLRFHASEVNIVAGCASGCALALELDGRALPPVTVTGDDLYRLVDGVEDGSHTLVLRPGSAGFQAYSFTFGSGTQ